MSSMNGLPACVVSGSPLTRITAGTCHISGEVYGVCEEKILPFDTSPRNYNACMGNRLSVLPVERRATCDDVRSTALTDGYTHLQIVVL